ncbi:hypothetical protein WG901_20730 [Novosphingobium sp. PS1R-30]|uniref:Uncharacterized protein n=1 Tax=Novosphingobium anseongense TaxID=3133436 RepID=A0ABU8S191_9SPHN|nr:MAG: hypothetical protein EOO76_15765 [Novosphingobium sp.]
MSVWKTGLAIAGLAFTPLVVMGFTYGSSAVLGKPEQGAAHGTEGSRRDVILAGLTEVYVSRGHPATSAMQQGKALAPIDYLNLKLKSMGLPWRVTRTDGSTAKTYAVS